MNLVVGRKPPWLLACGILLGLVGLFYFARDFRARKRGVSVDGNQLAIGRTFYTEPEVVSLDDVAHIVDSAKRSLTLRMKDGENRTFTLPIRERDRERFVMALRQTLNERRR